MKVDEALDRIKQSVAFEVDCYEQNPGESTEQIKELKRAARTIERIIVSQIKQTNMILKENSK